MYTSCLPNAHRGQKRMLNPQELELWMIIEHHPGPENQIQVHCKSRKCCWLLAEPSLQPHAGFFVYLVGWSWGLGFFFPHRGLTHKLKCLPVTCHEVPEYIRLTRGSQLYVWVYSIYLYNVLTPRLSCQPQISCMEESFHWHGQMYT